MTEFEYRMTLLKDRPVMHFMLKHRALIILIVTLVCVGGLNSSNTIIAGLCISFIAGAVFWFMACWIPEYSRHKILKASLRLQYFNFKICVIRILEKASGAFIDDAKIVELINCEKFKRWNNSLDGHSDFIDAAMSELDRDQRLLNELLYEFHNFSKIVGELKCVVNCYDAKQLAALCFLEKRLYDFENKTDFNGDKTKYIGEFIFEVFGGFSQDKGNTNVDWVQQCIDNI